MSTFQVVFRRSALKDLKRIPRMVLPRVREAIRSLTVDPLPGNAVKLEGYDHYYRIRVGDYRIVYEVAKKIRIITIVKVGHRKNVYRKFR